MEYGKARVRFKKLLKIYDNLKDACYQHMINGEFKSTGKEGGTNSVSIGVGGPTFQEFGKKFSL